MNRRAMLATLATLPFWGRIGGEPLSAVFNVEGYRLEIRRPPADYAVPFWYEDPPPREDRQARTLRASWLRAPSGAGAGPRFERA